MTNASSVRKTRYDSNNMVRSCYDDIYGCDKKSLALRFAAEKLRGAFGSIKYRMLQYLKTYDHAFTSEFCSELISVFESNPRLWEEEGRLTALSLRDREPWATKWSELREQISTVVNQLAEQYGQDLKCREWWPDSYAQETSRIKRYAPELYQCFPPHVDVDRRANSGRFLSFLFYLNDSDAGTRFVSLDHTVSARQGRCLVFPPQWQFPHEGLLPQSEPKYILSSYLHYV